MKLLQFAFDSREESDYILTYMNEMLFIPEHMIMRPQTMV